MHLQFACATDLNEYSTPERGGIHASDPDFIEEMGPNERHGTEKMEVRAELLTFEGTHSCYVVQLTVTINDQFQSYRLMTRGDRLYDKKIAEQTCDAINNANSQRSEKANRMAGD